MKHIHHFLIICLLLLFSSCFSGLLMPVNKNVSAQYNPASVALHPFFRVFHASETQSNIFVKLYTSELNFSKKTSESKKQAVVKLKYLMLKTFHSEGILDSGTVVFHIPDKANQNNIVSFFTIKRPSLKNFILQISLYDTYSNKSSISFISVDNQANNNQNYYLPNRAKDGKPYFWDWTNKNELINIKNNLPDSLLKISFYKINFPPAFPPFSSEINSPLKKIPDTSWTVSNEKFTQIKIDSIGIYRFSASSNSEKGLYFNYFGTQFPDIQTSTQLANTLQYLLSAAEYKKMRESANIKLAVDNFWLKVAQNNTNKAKELIQIWYNRAKYSNYYFSSYTEGWKTDKGMIYMVFGPPQTVNTTDGAERWTYTNNKNIKPINFIFIKNEVSGFANDYTLKHEIMYRNYWFEAIDSWRAGAVYHYRQ